MANAVSASQRRGILITAVSVALFSAFLVSAFVYQLSKPIVLSDSELKSRGTFLFEKPRSFKAFDLTDDLGQAFTPANLQGKWSLIFFGFTYCPDICPTTMALMNRFYESQREEDYFDDLQVVMVSVDPARDSVPKLNEYVRYFNKDFVGVTGEFLDLHRFATQLNIPFSKVPGSGENYLVEHSGNVAIINPKGHYVGFFRAPIELSKLNLGYQSIRATR